MFNIETDAAARFGLVFLFHFSEMLLYMPTEKGLLFLVGLSLNGASGLNSSR